MVIYRAIRVISIVLAFIITTVLVRLRYRKDNIICMQKLAESTHIHARRIVRLFNIHVETDGAEKLPAPCLAVCNHLSYIDIIVISSIRPTQFISHRGVQRSPLVGNVAAAAGTLFVDKSSPSGLVKDISSLADMLKAGICITIFPEGGTGSGESVRHFHPALIEAATRSTVPVIPMRIQYTVVNGETLTPANKDLIYIYGNKPFLPHIFTVVANVRSMAVSLRTFDPISPIGLERKQIAETAREIIADDFRAF